jgi:fatty acid desaturase
MFLHLGESWHGKIDQVPGVLYRVTRFFSFNFFPLIPLGGLVVLEKKITGGERWAVKAPMSFVSFFIGYIRLFLFVFSLMTLVIGGTLLIEGIGKRNEHFIILGMGVLAFLAWWGTHRLTHANYETACRWADHAGVPREIIDEYFQNRNKHREISMTDNTPMEQFREEKDDVFRLE